MRYYATVDGGLDNPLPSNAGQQLKIHASENLRNMRVVSGYDYVGFDLAGTLIDYRPGMDLAYVAQQIGDRGALSDKTRLVVAPDGVADLTVAIGFELCLAVHRGSQYAWTPGGATSAGVITVDNTQTSRKISAVVIDVFQDIMVANSPTVAAVLEKYLTSGRTMMDFYALKAQFARQRVADGEPTLFTDFSPKQYASFSAVARRGFYLSMTESELTAFARLWTDFLTTYLQPHFLSAEEAARLVRLQRFRTARAERVGGAGQKTKSRSKRGFLKGKDLVALFSDRQLVHSAGSYILCVVNRPTGPGADDLGPVFGWNKPGVPNRLKLCSEKQYGELTALVRRGLVTPIRLFLQAAPKGDRR